MKPILFNTDMVQALLEGRKSVTRRIVKPQHLLVLDSPYHHKHPETPDEVLIEKLCAPPYRPGDILYVRETWKVYEAGNPPPHCVIEYKAGGTEKFSKIIALPTAKGEWRPSIHMPKEAARLFLRVTAVRVERLLTPFFSDGAAVLALRQEGMVLPRECVECIGNYGVPACIDAGEDSECGILDEIRGDFSYLWDSTIKPADLPLYGWADDPLVWVIEFERISKEAALDGGN